MLVFSLPRAAPLALAGIATLSPCISRCPWYWQPPEAHAQATVAKRRSLAPAEAMALPGPVTPVPSVPSSSKSGYRLSLALAAQPKPLLASQEPSVPRRILSVLSSRLWPGGRRLRNRYFWAQLRAPTLGLGVHSRAQEGGPSALCVSYLFRLLQAVRPLVCVPAP